MVASKEGASGCAISGTAMSGIYCDQPFHLSLTVTDCFSNCRHAPNVTNCIACLLVDT